MMNSEHYYYATEHFKEIITIMAVHEWLEVTRWCMFLILLVIKGGTRNCTDCREPLTFGRYLIVSLIKFSRLWCVAAWRHNSAKSTWISVQKHYQLCAFVCQFRSRCVLLTFHMYSWLNLKASFFFIFVTSVHNQSTIPDQQCQCKQPDPGSHQKYHYNQFRPQSPPKIRLKPSRPQSWSHQKINKKYYCTVV